MYSVLVRQPIPAIFPGFSADWAVVPPEFFEIFLKPKSLIKNIV
jgi:hypothetical protein